ncbi:hypothetical protein GGX14DRAFT_397371 [Mycena pura]|uniref:DUF6534 domain-containing protein n=1 Tax=Mycena pura TaxID=153505 RepID=A0AAD6Y7T8_9AGAR|nr:hypothetical protein GGX14DRAFT_397371 [Mycena pura]
MGELDTTLGAIAVCYMLAWGLYGVMSTQTFSYFQKFNVSDSLWLKGLVAVLWLLDTLQLVLIGHVLYYWLITNYANPAVLADSVWFLTYRVFVCESSPAFASHGSYKKPAVSSGNRILSGIIVLLSFCYFGFEMAVQVRTTDSLVNKLILYAMSTGLLTSCLVGHDLRTPLKFFGEWFMTKTQFLTMPNNLIHISFNIVVGKLYTNSLLASLNFRDVLRTSRAGPIANTISLSSLHASGRRHGGAGSSHQTIAVSANGQDNISTHLADEKCATLQLYRIRPV